MRDSRRAMVGLVVLLAALVMLGARLLWLPVGAATPTPTLAVSDEIREFQNPLRTVDVTFVQTSTVAGAVDLFGLELKAIEMPASWVTADITFQASQDCSTYSDLYGSDGYEYAIETAASRYVIVPEEDFSGLRCLKIRSGTTGTPVTQTTSIDLTLIVRPR